MKKIKTRKLFLNIIFSILLWALVTYLGYCFLFKNIKDNVDQNFPPQGIKYFFDILVHNSINYLTTLLGFCFSPLLILMNNVTLALTIANNAGIFGWKDTLDLLPPHGFFEVPTVLMYQYLSFGMFINFLKNHSWYKLKKYIFVNKRYFLISYLGVFFFCNH